MKTCCRCGKETDGGFICENTGKFNCSDCNNKCMNCCYYTKGEHEHTSWGTLRRLEK